ncbi:histidine kinase N-terminal 7TM domain-containing protein [Halobaculum lipolyticum]|uniref:histidine kinase n=1 Tax=Halobaculum lipolyticum TaxID=3032001 RepID=A0ABD5WAE8_9EURY|nr:histidine kinase N-terminal 7TM domain-containing protein [Halobaculum sp. DT31]
MTWQLQPIVGLYLVSAVVGVATAAALWRRDHGPGGSALAATLALAGGWALAVALEHAAADLAGKLSAVKAGYVFVALLPVAWVVFAWRFTARPDRIDRRTLAGLSVVPALTVAAVWLSPEVPLFWRDAGVRVVAGTATLDTTYGPWFAVHAAYSYLLLVAGGIAIGRTAVLTIDTHPIRGSAVLAGVLAPAVSNALFLLGAAPAGVDPTPPATVAGGVLLAVAFVRHDLLDGPTAARAFARDTAVTESMEGVLVLTDDGVVTDCNPAAAAAIGVDRDEALGRPFEGVAPGVAEAARAVVDHDGSGGIAFGGGRSVGSADSPGRITRSVDGDKRHYDVSVSDFSRRGLSGRIVTLRDVTDRHRHRRRVGVLNRILRHDLRNEMNVVMGYAEVLESELDRARDGTVPPADGDPGVAANGGDGTEAVERIRESADELLDLSDTVREVGATLDAEGSTTTRLDVAALVRTQADGLEFRSPTPRVTVDSPDEAWVTASDLIDAVFENLLENAVEHSHRETPSVDVTVAVDDADGTVAVTVADDGPGIPQQELATFRADGETALTHSSGLGLWLVIWIVEESGGEVTFDVDETGTAVTVRLPGAEPPS